MDGLALLGVGATALFCAVALLAARDAGRRRTRAAVALALALALLALVSLLGHVPHDRSGWPFALTIVAFAASGLAVLEYRAALFGLPRRWRAAALGATTVAVTILVATSATGPAASGPLVALAALTFVGVWSACLLETAWRLWTATRTAAPVQAAQLRLQAATFLALAVVVLTTYAVTFAEAVPEALRAALGVLTASAGLALYLSVHSPRALRTLWVRRRTLADVDDLVPVGAWHFDVATRESWWSPAMRETLGIGSDEHASIRRFLELVHPDDREHMRARLASTVVEQAAIDDVYRVVRPADGATIWVRGVGDVYLDLEGRDVIAVYGTLHDVTAHKEAEQQLRAALSREQAAADELRRLDEMKSAFLAAVSHELRTPLTALKGFASVLDRHEDRLDEETRGVLVRRLVDNVDRLEALFADLLDLERLGRGVVEAAPGRVNVARIVQRVVARQEWEGREVVLGLPGDAVIAIADPTQIERMLAKLADNAVHHTPPGTTVWIRVLTSPEAVELVVEDDGPGIADDMKTEIFHRFRHGSAAPTRGAGIGLAIVAELAAIHGGRAWVSDRDGGGASFHVRLPVRAATAEEAPARVS